MRQTPTDTALVRQVKQAVSDDLKLRYTSEKHKELLHMTSLLEPRYKQVPFLSEEDKLEAYYNLTLNTIDQHQRTIVKKEPEDTLGTASKEPKFSDPPLDPSASSSP